MPHTLVSGTTESGKTTICLRLANKYHSKKIGVIVLDPMGDPRWTANLVTDDKELFLQTVWGSQRCAVFIDESGDTIGQYDNEMRKVLTKGRHWGHNVHVTVQRAKMVNPSVRNMCNRLIMFTTAFEDAKELGKDFNRPELAEIGPQLPQGHYVYCDRFNIFERGQLW